MPTHPFPRGARAVVALGLVVLFGWAAWERFRLPLTPLTDPDLRVYLGPAMHKLLGEAFQTYKGQCFLYPWFLYVVLRVGGDFRGVTLVQNLLGLGTGALLFGCWRQFRHFVSAPRLPSLGYDALGALMVGVYLFSTETIAFERALRPEAVFPFVIVLSIFCNLCFIRDRFFDGQARRVLLSGGGAVFCSVAAFLLKPSFSVALGLANLPVILSLFRAGQSFRGKCLLVAIPMLAAGTLLIWPEWKLRQNNTDGARFLAQSLFSVHADLINDQLGDDLARHAVTPYPPEYLATVHDALTESLRESRQGNVKFWPALGFNPDHLLYGSREHESFMRRFFGGLNGHEGKADFCRYYYWRTFRQRPGRMVAKIGRQLGVFYRFGDCPAYLAQFSLSLGERYALSAKPLTRDQDVPRYAPGVAFIDRTKSLTTSEQQIGPYPLLNRVSRFLAASYLGWCLWAVVLGVAAWRVPSMRPAFGIAAPVLLLLYAYNFGTVLALAIGHSLDVGRYSQYQLAFTVLPEFGSVWLALEAVAIAGRKIRRGSKLEFAALDLSPMNAPNTPPSVNVIVFAGVRSGEEYRAVFPGARTISAQADAAEFLNALAEINRDALLFVDADAGHPVEAIRQLITAYTMTPADLLIGGNKAHQRVATWISRAVMRLIFGCSACDPVSGVWLCSRRFYQNVPIFPRRDARWLQPEFLLQAFDKGYSVQEVCLPAVSASADTRRSVQRDTLGSLARLLRLLLAGSIYGRPLRVLGTLGIGALLLGIFLGYAPLRHASQKKTHPHPGRIIASSVLVVAGLLGLHAGLLLEGAARRGREAHQLRLRSASTP